MPAADGAAILFHDDRLDRTTDGTGPVAEANLAALQALDAGIWFGPEFRGEKIPTLRQAIRPTNRQARRSCRQVHHHPEAGPKREQQRQVTPPHRSGGQGWNDAFSVRSEEHTSALQ